jgi:hypothetical protein
MKPENETIDMVEEEIQMHVVENRWEGNPDDCIWQGKCKDCSRYFDDCDGVGE